MADTRGVGVTVISHDSEDTTYVNGFDLAGSYSRDVNYQNASLLQLEIKTSLLCQASVSS